jgi:hypothetical protein
VSNSIFAIPRIDAIIASIFTGITDEPSLTAWLVIHSHRQPVFYHPTIPFNLVCFDCDSTLVSIEGIDELARLKGQFDHIADLTRRAMNGELKIEMCLRNDCAYCNLPAPICTASPKRIAR